MEQMRRKKRQETDLAAIQAFIKIVVAEYTMKENLPSK